MAKPPSLSLSWPARAYLALVIAAGLIASTSSVASVVLSPPAGEWYWLTLLTLFSGFLPVKFRSVGARFSISETFVFSGTLLYGQAVGTVLVLLDALVLSGKVFHEKRRMDWVRTPFNLAAPPLSVWLASTVLFEITGPAPLALGDDPVLFVAGLALFTVLYFLLNSGLVALAIALSHRQDLKGVLRNLAQTWWSIRQLFLNYLAGASIAALLASGASGSTPNVGIHLMVTLPIMAVIYLTYYYSARQVDELQARIEAIKAVHMATIKAFAMAIDAKDQVTHGHIHRVQQYTMNLARHLGVTDENQLSAIEAAALLHDTGKLAIPEYILNKPGPLTTAEFEKMKDHAAVGANILQSIAFPYPVAPIVRHHHENWNGRGYPDGLSGQEIPLGARILSVVDCYDALTSDRPYRPRMSRQQAEQILLDRRGSMYDPWVVDGFLQILDRLEASEEAHVSLDNGAHRTATIETSPALDVISAATAEEREFAELRRELPKARSLHSAAEIFFRHVRRVIPAASVVMYAPSGSSELAPVYCAGSGASTIEATAIPIGEKISGWAFAHRQIVFNSDASLDLGPVARTLPVPLRVALVAPLLDGSHAIGVIALYGSEEFKRDHRRMLESAIQLLVAGVPNKSVAPTGTEQSREVTPRRLH